MLDISILNKGGTAARVKPKNAPPKRKQRRVMERISVRFNSQGMAGNARAILMMRLSAH